MPDSRNYSSNNWFLFITKRRETFDKLTLITSSCGRVLYGNQCIRVQRARFKFDEMKLNLVWRVHPFETKNIQPIKRDIVMKKSWKKTLGMIFWTVLHRLRRVSDIAYCIVIELEHDGRDDQSFWESTECRRVPQGGDAVPKIRRRGSLLSWRTKVSGASFGSLCGQPLFTGWCSVFFSLSCEFNRYFHTERIFLQWRLKKNVKQFGVKDMHWSMNANV